MIGFIEDSKPDNALWGIVLRSSEYCAEIEDIICPKIPKDITVLSADDIPGINAVRIIKESIPVLASKKINYIGEPILLLAGPDLTQLRHFAGQIKINLKKIKPLFPDDIQKDFLYEKTYTQGKPDKIFGKAFQVIEGEYITPWQEHHASDAGGALAIPGPEGLEVICPSQWIFHVRDRISEVCKIQKPRISVRQSNMSSSFDSRLWYPSLLAVYTSLLAIHSGKPVYLAMSREDELICSPKRTPVNSKIKTAVDQEGNLLAIEAEALVNMGACAVMVEELSLRLACGIKGIYKCDHFSITIRCYKTSFPPFGTFRGLAGAPGFFASELHTTRLAELSQDDPAKWKKANLPDIPVKYSPAFTIHTLIDEVAGKSDFSRKHSAYEIQNKSRLNMETSPLSPRGIGISSAYQFNGFCSLPEDSAVVRMTLDAENSLTIQTSMNPANAWVRNQWTETAADILAIAKKNVHLDCGTDARGIDTGPDIFCRNISMVLRLIRRCAMAISKQRFRSPLPLSVKRSLSSKAIGRTSLQNLIDDKSSDISWGACAIELEMDLFSLVPSIKGIWLSVATGIIKNRKLALSIIEAAVLQSLQWCTTDTFLPFHADDFLQHFHLPRVRSVPPVHISLLEDKHRQPVGIDDIADVLLPPAYLAAVSQAAGYYFDHIPVTPLQIANSMEAAEDI